MSFSQPGIGMSVDAARIECVGYCATMTAEAHHRQNLRSGKQQLGKFDFHPNRTHSHPGGRGNQQARPCRSAGRYR